MNEGRKHDCTLFIQIPQVEGNDVQRENEGVDTHLHSSTRNDVTVRGLTWELVALFASIIQFISLLWFVFSRSIIFISQEKMNFQPLIAVISFSLTNHHKCIQMETLAFFLCFSSTQTDSTTNVYYLLCLLGWRGVQVCLYLGRMFL